jgi:ergothioneine biosynthesis protein EgtB
VYFTRTDGPDSLIESYRMVRGFTSRLIAPLATEDMVPQSMPDASPVRWHLGHTTWFFERMVLAQSPGYHPINEAWWELFNSYYLAAGNRYPRPRRGLVTRPTVGEVLAYRSAIDEEIGRLLDRTADMSPEILDILQVGIHHEQQHQELILTDVKHLLSFNPLRPVYSDARPVPPALRPPVPGVRWIGYEGGLREIGHSGRGFAYDNEMPVHRVHLEPFRLADRLVTAGEYIEFIEAGGYREPLLWLDSGFAACVGGGWEAPLYWERRDGTWHQFSLHGLVPVDPHEPVCHLSYFEADAFSRWAGARLPSEAEWEAAALTLPVTGNLAESAAFHPAPASAAGATAPVQMFGDVWEWTATPYTEYPGFRKVLAQVPRLLAEYNGKWMSGQMVLRGGSCATPRSHIRATYRNFWPPQTRFQFSGLRLARDR